MRVALLSYDFGEYCIRLASALGRTVEVLLLLPHELAAPHLASLDPGVHFHPFHKPRLRQPVRQMRLAFDLRRRITAFEPDVIHIQQGHLWFNGLLPLLQRYPLVLTVHDARHHVGDRGGRKTPKAVMHFGFRRAARLITHAGSLKDALVAECRISRDVIHVIPHISLGTLPASSTPHDDGTTILFFGRIWPYKGLEYLIRAQPLISADVPEARIVIAGEGEDFGRYRRMMARGDRFTVLNEYISEQTCTELFQQASVVVLPYIEASQSGVIPLAYTFMKPVVATTVGGLPEMVDDGRTGYLVAPHDEHALAAAIVRLLRDEPLRRQLGLNGKRKLDTECAPEVVARRTLDVYHRRWRAVAPLRRAWSPPIINHIDRREQ